MNIHEVKKGDSLYKISQDYVVPIERLISDNDLVNPNLLLENQALIIRKDNTRHIVGAGETLSTIASSYNIPLERLYLINNLSSDSVIYPGDEIIISFENQEKTEMEINGYVYPDQDLNILREMLPRLTYLSIFSYTVNPDGSLNEIEDSVLIEEALNYNVAPIMVITNIEDETMFSSDLASTILVSTTLQDTLIDNVLTVLREKGYFGLDVDFEYIFPSDREKYIRFLRRLSVRLKEEGYHLSTALAPKTSSEMTGLLYEAHDYEAIGEIVDRVIIMTYEWGYSFSEAMSVAPIDKVREVIEYAVSVIDPAKILMGVPNYGYDFRVPIIEGEPARSITNFEAIQIARDNLVGIEFDTESMSPYFNYRTTEGILREVHFEDARSYLAKINLAIEYNLAGLSIWTLRSYFNPLWILIDNYLDVVKLI